MKMRKADVGVAIYIMAAIIMFIVPIPAWLLDILLAVNISIALTVLFATMFSKEVLDMSFFPTMLLFTTIFRIALNTSSTRLILRDGNAGNVVETFGEFVGGGDLVIGVQTVSRLGFVGTSIAISLVFISIVYMLSTCFQHIGKGLCVIIMVMQIPGSAGLYPIEMLPSFFRFLHPLFPFTYGVNALREIVAGFYGHTYLSCLAVLGAEALVAFAIGLALRPFLVNLNAMITRDLSSSGLFVAEATRVPSSRYRLTQIVAALADHEGFQRSVSARAARFERRYPRIRLARAVQRTGRYAGLRRAPLRRRARKIPPFRCAVARH